MSDDIEVAAVHYSEALKVAQQLGVSAEPEAQLTVPIASLFRVIADHEGIGELSLLREAQLDGVRPDFAALIDRRACGWIELKAPGHTLDGERWRGREAQQWRLLSQLDSLIVSDGEKAVLYREGTELGSADLPVNGPDGWDLKPLAALLRLFVAAKPATIRRVSQLSRKLAPLAALLRERLHQGVSLNAEGFVDAVEAWEVTIQRKTTPESFASDVAQVVSYAMAIAALNGDADRDGDGLISIDEARIELRQGPNNVLAAALGPILGVPEFIEYARPEIGAIERLVSAIDAEAVRETPDSRGEPWLWFYEDFLATYDAAARNAAGVYYTPTAIVQCQTRLVDDILRNQLDRPLGFGAQSVVTLDPATGSGTYPLAIIDHAVQVAEEERGPAGATQVSANLTKNLAAFELLPGPYAVAHLRIGQRLAEVSRQWHQLDPIRVYLTDTLEGPDAEPQRGLFGDARILADEAAKARQIKHGDKVTVVIGNPPYDRVAQGEAGGWVLHPEKGRALFQDVIEPAKRAGVIFSAQASLYNLYVYFWRWAMWKAFEEHPDEAAVVSFITASSWLRGDAFRGLRELASDHADEIWVIDLGGDGRGARVEENVFAIQSPVAIVTMYRRSKSKSRKSAAQVRYRRLRGTSSEKLAALSSVNSPRTQEDEWIVMQRQSSEPLAPLEGDEDWNDHPALTDLFPWQQPGMMAGRSWVVSPSPGLLKQRWAELLEDPREIVRAERYVTPTSGRNIHTKVAGLPKLASLPSDASSERVVRTAWRSFDRQWTFQDSRLVKTESPSLWASMSPQQVFFVGMLTTPLGEGPALTVSTEVPDKHYFANRGGKDVIPLYRDAQAQQPNLAKGLLELLSATYGAEVTPEDLAAYVYALLAHHGYTDLFSAALADPGPRVPLTKNFDLFRQATEVGRKLLWLQTFGERFVTLDRPARRLPRVEGIGWRLPVAELPEGLRAISYDASSWELHVGDGVVTGVRPEVREFAVSGMNILDKWLGARTRKGIGRAATTRATHLDKMRPSTWEDEWNDELLDLLRVLTSSLDLAGQQAQLLEKVLEGKRFKADELPQPTAQERSVPEAGSAPRLL